MEQLTYSGWRPVRDHRPTIKPSTGPKDPNTIRYPEAPPIPPTRFFDQLSFIGDEFVGCFALETDVGIVLLDCMWPDDRCVRLIEDGLKELGLDPADLRAIFITHGHDDHFGRGEYFREAYGTEIYMSETDYRIAATPGPHQHYKPMGYKPDHFLEDGKTYQFGSTSILAVSTPGHSAGCFSYIIPVFDEGRPHSAALWGGTGVPREPELKVQYLDSVRRFQALCDEKNVDCEISNHPFVDNSIERLAVCRSIVNGVPNPYVIGRDAYHRYEQMFYELCRRQMDQA